MLLLLPLAILKSRSRTCLQRAYHVGGAGARRLRLARAFLHRSRAAPITSRRPARARRRRRACATGVYRCRMCTLAGQFVLL